MNVITSGDGDDYFIEQDQPVSISKGLLNNSDVLQSYQSYNHNYNKFLNLIAYQLP